MGVDALNDKERVVLEVLARAGKATLTELAARAFPGEARANSWVRNCLRALRRRGQARQIGRGTYVAANVQRALPLATRCRRGTSNSNSRGNTKQRRARRDWMVKTFGSPTGKTIPCFHCGKRMRVNTKHRNKGRSWEIDRFPICGHDGGTYKRGNIVPSCPACNKQRCSASTARANCPGAQPQAAAP